jgi:CubicO group peptidase (beta-lactamase class C family)
MKTLSLTVGLLLAACGAGISAQQGPSPEMRARLDGVVRAFTTFDPKSPEMIDKLREEAFTADFRTRLSAEQLRKMAAQMLTDFGAYRIGEVRRNDPDSVVLMVTGAKANGRIILGVKEDPPHLIESIGVELGTGDGNGREDGPAPEINGRMTPAELSTALDDFFVDRAARDEFSGAILIARDGVPVAQKAYGFADRNLKRPNALDTRFNIGSINKAFTQTAIQQLVARGTLSLADTIGKILPAYPNKDALGATVDQLLNHTAGIADFFGPAFDAAPKDQFRSNADYVRFVAPMPLTFPPGTSRRYCNGCYIVLGAMIEQVSGMPYEQYIEKNVFEPAGMKTAGWLDDTAPDVAMGYIREGGALHANRATRGARGSAAGGGYATVADLLAFDIARRSGLLVDRKTMDGGGARGGTGIAGGAPGLNAVLESAGAWTVVVLSNFDPPSAEDVGPTMARRLTR